MSNAEPLPGMDEVLNRGMPDLEKAARRAIKRLHELGYVEEMHALHTASIVELAQIISEKHRSGRMSTVGNDMRAMVDLLDRLVPERDDSDDAGLEKAMAEWSEQAGL